MNKKINVGITKTDIGYFVDLHYTIIAGSYSPNNTALKNYTTDVETLNYALKPLNLEIVEKRTAKKPIIKNVCNEVDGDVDYGTCPNCEYPLDYSFNYCPGCGQALDWSDDND